MAVVTELFYKMAQGNVQPLLGWLLYVEVILVVVCGIIWAYRLTECLGLYDPLLILPLMVATYIVFGGIAGGISTGQPLVVRIAIKPTSSILTPRRSVDLDGDDVEVVTKGRHDPCVGIRGVPVAEAMMAVTLADAVMRHKAQCGLF